MKRDNVKTGRLAAPWTPVFAIIGTIVSFAAAQILAGSLIGFYPSLRHWPASQTQDWLNNSIVAQFIYILLAESLTVGILWLFWRRFASGVRQALGLARRFQLSDINQAVAGILVYYVAYIFIVGVVASHFLTINPNDTQQNVGFQEAQGFGQLLLTFVGLVILPPIVEEIMFRGFLYAGLRRAFKPLAATLITSLFFAAPHLLTGMPGKGLLWIAAADTFILSLVLCRVREKTGALYSGMLVHAIKNSVAFALLFLR